MSYRVLVAETTEDLFGDNPYGAFLAFNNFKTGEEAMKFANVMMKYGKAVAILPVGESDE